MFATPQKILDLKALQRRCNAWRVRHDDLVFTHGTFELLHPVHTAYLEEARALGERLIVGVYADSIAGQPVMDEQERSHLLAALLVVDGVVVLHVPTPDEAIQALQPQVVVDGVEAIAPKASFEVVQQVGARYVSLVRPDLSRSEALLQRIRG
jgi:D-beta-D-heptose 7-phosphate kinase / D-beta-D-heptose 1-phosphate adenosyltransferase